MGNPFTENNSDLIVLDTRDIADPAIIESVRQTEKFGADQYELYVQERLVEKTKNINKPIKRNNLALFHCPPVREHSKSQQQLSSLENDCCLFACMLHLKYGMGIWKGFLSMKTRVIHSSISHNDW